MVVHIMTHLKLHHHIVEFVIPSAADELTDVIFSWRRRTLNKEENVGNQSAKKVYQN